MRMKKVGVRELEDKVRAGRPAPMRVGATDNPNRRAGEYSQEYSETSTMYYAKTSNMKSAEDRLLHMCDKEGKCRDNVQMSSNVPASASRGYVYAISR